MSPMLWWVIPLVAAVAAHIWTRVGGLSVGRVPAKPEPGSPQDLADLAKFAAALREVPASRARPDDA